MTADLLVPLTGVGTDFSGLAFLAFAAFLAGLVRGFAGFGSALVFLPLATQFVSPIDAILMMVVKDLLGPLVNLRRSFRVARLPELARLLIGAAMLLPVGAALLIVLPPDTFRWGISILALVVLALTAGNVRYRKPLSSSAVFVTGAGAGFLGGLTGLTGPVVILFYMASPFPVQVIRGTIMLFLLGSDFMLLVVFGLRDVLSLNAAMVGLMLVAPSMLGNVLGSRMFDPSIEWVYRSVAYTLIAVSALWGLPFFD